MFVRSVGNKFDPTTRRNKEEIRQVRDRVSLYDVLRQAASKDPSMCIKHIGAELFVKSGFRKLTHNIKSEVPIGI